MRVSSPPIAIYKAPLKGMDAREVKPDDAPNLLFNVDLSNRGYWKERPGLRKFASLGDSRNKVVGLHTTRVDNNLLLIGIVADTDDEFMAIHVLDAMGNSFFNANLTNPTSAIITEGSEPYNEKARYSFVNAGRFVYFCNGRGSYWELEVIAPSLNDFKLKLITLETGKTPLSFSYVLNNLSPSSFTYFFDQIIVTGFKETKACQLSIPATSEEQNNRPPSEVLNAARDEMTVDQGAVLVCEPALWRSFPVEDPSGFYWVFNESILASAGIGFDILLFGSKRLYKITGHGGGSPRRIRLGDIPSVSSRGHCYFDRFVFFVGFDGCYITDGGPPRKVSFEMDPLWFGQEEPQTTRYVEQRLQKGAYPFHVNRRALSGVTCVNDQSRQQIMVCLPANDSPVNNMVWVYNYADIIEGGGQGKWSIWGGDEEPTFSGTALSASTSFPTNPSAPTQSNTTYNIFHWLSVADDIYEGQQTIFVGTDLGEVYEFGPTRQDFQSEFTYTRGGVRGGTQTIVHFPVAISLGRVGRVDSDGRVICTDIAVRRKQLGYNVDDNANATVLNAVVRSEGEGLKHFDVSETDVEFSGTILNAQQGVSENTKSVINSMVLGASPAGSNAPLMNSEYFEAYARVNVPDEEGRAAYVDLYSMPTSEPHRLKISEVRVYANVKGGSQREQS
tara:strand:- start:7164 stop:9182 length:2019 start_codon:yes stop_codon:yes gene_type:complete